MNIPPARLATIARRCAERLATLAGAAMERELATFARQVEGEHELTRRPKPAKRERR